MMVLDIFAMDASGRFGEACGDGFLDSVLRKVQAGTQRE
jgi:hypothetical protein